MQFLLIAFVVVAAIGGTHLSWSVMDKLIGRLKMEPRDWVIQRWRAGISE